VTNFGERIAYWYLRLQGFLLAEDFVLHRGGQIKRTADHDLLALRLKHSQEEINEQILPRDDGLEKQLGTMGRNVALIVQVKTGADNDAGTAWRQERLLYAIRFLGAVAPDEANDLAVKLADRPLVECATDWTVAKLLVAEVPTNEGSLSVTLQHALRFIQARLGSHPMQKAADRLLFPGELMQFLAWSASNIDKKR
jgi:hypothetical protein